MRASAGATGPEAASEAAFSRFEKRRESRRWGHRSFGGRRDPLNFNQTPVSGPESSAIDIATLTAQPIRLKRPGTWALLLLLNKQ